MMNENLPNGIPSLHESVKTGPSNETGYVPFNGVGSIHSSRDSSPCGRLQQIPLSQLPPNKMEIPASQLPPNRSMPVSGLVGSMSQMSVTRGNEHTPFTSPKVSASFNTSTPVQDISVAQNLTSVKQKVLSPVVSNVANKSTEKEVSSSAFTHSSTSQFTSVKNNPGSNDSNKNVLDANSYFPQVSNASKTTDGNTVQSQVQSNKPVSQTATLFPAVSQQSAPQFANFSSQRPVQQQQATQSNAFPNGNHSRMPNINQIQTSQNNFLRFSTPQHIPSHVGAMQSSQFHPAHPSMQTTLSQSKPNTSSLSHMQNIPLSSTQVQPGLKQTRPPHPNQLQDLQRQSQQLNFHPSQQSFQQPLQNLQQPLQNLQQSQQNLQQAYNFQKNIPPINFQQSQNPMPLKSNILPGPPQASQGFSQISQQSTPTISDQNRAHLHTNRYPQRPNTSPAAVQQQQQFPQYVTKSTTYPNQNQPNSMPNQLNQQSYQQPPGNTYQNQGNFNPNAYPATQQSKTYQNYPNVTQTGFNKLWGSENFDLLQCPNILPITKVEPPRISIGQELLDSVNCSPDIFRCTMTKIPESTALLQKSRLPLGVLIHPFKDLNHLPVIQCNTIVRCRTCRTYINPFVFFVDSKRWKCNLCYRVNELPEEFQYDPVSKTYGDPSRRPEVKSSTIEYIAPAEYMLRPPQPAVYMYLFDVSRLAVESGYLHTVCNVLSTEISNIPGDTRTQIGFLAYDSALHFYSLSEGQNQPHEMTVLDIDDIFIPCPDNLLVNLQDRIELVTDLLTQLPIRFANTCDTGSALGAALQAAYKMTSATGGRITVFQTTLPNKGPGAVTSREDPNQRSAAEVQHLNPAIDFYKRQALECSGQQIAVDLFILNSQYVDLATISGISRFSGGCIHHFPLFKASRTLQNDGFEKAFRRYVTRKIGFEAVMRIRCTRGLTIHTFHGNFFVRSTDLLSLPNINPDAGFGMQVQIEENLSDVQTICFQAALLYTSSKGERRIRVHTLCLPIANTLQDVINSADQQCIIGLLSKMAVDRSMQSSLSDAREAFLNVAIDILSSYKLSLNLGSGANGLMAPDCLKLLPLYISALLKSVAFRVGTSTRLDDRIRAMCDMKTKPLPYLIQQIYPDLYPVHNLEEQNTILNDEEEPVHTPPHLQLTARNLDSNGAYLLDTGDHMILFVCSDVSPVFLREVLDTNEYNTLSEDFFELPTLNNLNSRRLQMFVNFLNDDKPYPATLQVIKENSPHRIVFLERLIEDRLENSLSYHEFLQHVKSQVK